MLFKSPLCYGPKIKRGRVFTVNRTYTVSIFYYFFVRYYVMESSFKIPPTPIFNRGFQFCYWLVKKS